MMVTKVEDTPSSALKVEKGREIFWHWLLLIRQLVENLLMLD
jgi:hypothetical protein